ASEIDQVVFDKTGTITTGNHMEMNYHGPHLSDQYKTWIRSLAHQSAHPVSRQLDSFLSSYPLREVSSFTVNLGEGIQGFVEGHQIEIGSQRYFAHSGLAPGTYIAIDGELQGSFSVAPRFRPGLEKVVCDLSKTMVPSVLTGDNSDQEQALRSVFGPQAELRFSHHPEQKLQYVKEKQYSGERIMMIGDGLNDAGALKQSDLGIVVTEHISNFVPACDAILDAQNFTNLPSFLKYLKRSTHLVYIAYGIALVYNVIGLSYAVQGILSPVIAAILMPLSSVTIVMFGIGSSTILARRMLD
ncbi:MAG: HAD-IC family P-type ATPase, partial [Saprospiraceae bacterium]|nr:HAD-IC family P-type ATPase [Saprospiraceae bacterium]